MSEWRLCGYCYLIGVRVRSWRTGIVHCLVVVDAFRLLWLPEASGLRRQDVSSDAAAAVSGETLPG